MQLLRRRRNTPPVDGSAPAGRPLLQQSTVVAIVYVAAMFLSALDTTIVSVALNTFAAEFGSPVASVQWVVVAYLLSLAVSIPVSGWLGDRFGTKRMFLLAVATFTLASALCGIAQNLPQMVAFRVLQGLGGGTLMPIGLTMLFREFPPERRAAAARVLIVPTTIAPALGPVLGGLLIDSGAWRWIFFVNVPIGIAAVVFGTMKLTEHREATAGRLDLPGFILAAVGMTALLYALSQGPTAGWGATRVLVSAGVAAVGLTMLVVVEHRSERPMLNLRLLQNRLFRFTNLVSVCVTAAFIGIIFIVPLLAQTLRGRSALASGMMTAPHALGVLLGSQVAIHLYRRFGPSKVMTGGALGMSLALGAMGTIGEATSDTFIYIEMFMLGVVYACVYLSLQTSSFAGISAAETGRASALYNTQRQAAAALGVALLATTLSAFLPDDRADIAGSYAAYHKVFLVAAAITLVGAVVARLVPDGEAASTMRVPAPAPAPAEP